MNDWPVAFDICQHCGKVVDDDEWVANWGDCNDCFNKHLEQFPIVRDFRVKC